MASSGHTQTANQVGAANAAPATLLYKRFEQHAELTPDAIAVSFGADSLSYAELDQRANRLAHELLQLGVGPEVLVGLCMRPSTELVASMLAIHKAGGAYLPLDPSYPVKRLCSIVVQADCRLVLTG